jgi:hypothetical protein
MPEYERSVSLSVGAERAFEFLADPENLTKYVANMVSARRQDGDRLRVAADVQGRHEEGVASFRSDAAAHRLEWGSPVNPQYHGWLEVAGSGSQSTVTIHVTTDRPEEAEEADRVLDQTVANIRAHLRND